MNKGPSFALHHHPRKKEIAKMYFIQTLISGIWSVSVLGCVMFCGCGSLDENDDQCNFVASELAVSYSHVHALAGLLLIRAFGIRYFVAVAMDVVVEDILVGSLAWLTILPLLNG